MIAIMTASISAQVIERIRTPILTTLDSHCIISFKNYQGRTERRAMAITKCCTLAHEGGENTKGLHSREWRPALIGVRVATLCDESAAVGPF
jgi:hypothetical protein